jgi:RecA/RadA recombinase
MASQDAPLTSPLSRTYRPSAPILLAHADLAIDRLPTISASQALHSLKARGARTVSTGISQLNTLLSPPSLPGHHVSGGYMRGKVTEIFGPPGVGKTSFG